MLYAFFLLLLFGLFYAPFVPVASVLNQMQTALTLRGLDLFLEPGQLQGIDIIINPHYKIIINQACNGMIPILFLWASILAYPAPLQHKLLWLIVGYVVFTVVNIVRILFVVFFVGQEAGRGNFYWSHDIVGNALLMLTGLGLFVTFIKRAKNMYK